MITLDAMSGEESPNTLLVTAGKWVVGNAHRFQLLRNWLRIITNFGPTSVGPRESIRIRKD